MAAKIDALSKNSKFLIVMVFVGPLTITIRNYEFLRSQPFLDASILAAMAVKVALYSIFCIIFMFNGGSPSS